MTNPGVSATRSKRPPGIQEGWWGCRVVLSKPVTKPVVQYLSAQVAQGYTRVTWNGVGFDFNVLIARRRSGSCLESPSRIADPRGLRVFVPIAGRQRRHEPYLRFPSTMST
jgi:hypothetical protein